MNIRLILFLLIISSLIFVVKADEPIPASISHRQYYEQLNGVHGYENQALGALNYYQLGRESLPDLLTFLTVSLSSSYPIDVSSALWVLGSLGYPESIHQLVRLVEDEQLMLPTTVRNQLLLTIKQLRIVEQGSTLLVLFPDSQPLLKIPSLDSEIIRRLNPGAELIIQNLKIQKDSRIYSEVLFARDGQAGYLLWDSEWLPPFFLVSTERVNDQKLKLQNDEPPLPEPPLPDPPVNEPDAEEHPLKPRHDGLFGPRTGSTVREKAVPRIIPLGVVNADRVNVRKTPPVDGRYGEKIDQLNRRGEIVILGTKVDGWREINYYSERISSVKAGFILDSFVEPLNEEAGQLFFCTAGREALEMLLEELIHQHSVEVSELNTTEQLLDYLQLKKLPVCPRGSDFKYELKDNRLIIQCVDHQMDFYRIHQQQYPSFYKNRTPNIHSTGLIKYFARRLKNEELTPLSAPLTASKTHTSNAEESVNLLPVVESGNNLADFPVLIVSGSQVMLLNDLENYDSGTENIIAQLDYNEQIKMLFDQRGYPEIAEIKVEKDSKIFLKVITSDRQMGWVDLSGVILTTERVIFPRFKRRLVVAIASINNNQVKYDLWLLDQNNQIVRKLASSIPNWLYSRDISLSGEQLIFSSLEGSQLLDLTRERIQLIDSSAYAAIFSPDGRSLFYRKRDKTQPGLRGDAIYNRILTSANLGAERLVIKIAGDFQYQEKSELLTIEILDNRILQAVFLRTADQDDKDDNDENGDEPDSFRKITVLFDVDSNVIKKSETF